MHELLGRYADRLDHPERRPDDALPVEVLTIAYPLMHLVAAGRLVQDPTAARRARPGPGG